MIIIAIRAMWDAARLIIMGIVAGCSLACWAVVALGVISGRM